MLVDLLLVATALAALLEDDDLLLVRVDPLGVRALDAAEGLLVVNGLAGFAHAVLEHADPLELVDVLIGLSVF